MRNKRKNVSRGSGNSSTSRHYPIQYDLPSDYKELFNNHAQHLNYLMATHDFKWTGSWCTSIAVTSDEGHVDHQTQHFHTAQGQYRAIFPLGSTASMDEYQLTVLSDFIQCWQTYVEFATRTQENGSYDFL